MLERTLFTRIRALCKERGLSLRQLEQDAGIANNTICRWGDNIPSVDKVKRVADALGVTVDELLRENTHDP